MQITKHKIVAIDYKLTDNEGTLIDSSDGKQPLTYLHGTGQIVPGLERALEGQSTGDQIQVVVDPEDAYGARRDSLLSEVSRSHFAEVDKLEVGMQFRVPTDKGNYHVVTVIDVTDEVVTIDGNHPLAGVTLNFDIAVRDVREASETEIQQGHAAE